MVDVIGVVEEDMSHAELLEVTVIETGHDDVVYCVPGVGDRNLACVAGHLKVIVCRHFFDPSSKSFCGLLRELLSFVETDCVDGPRHEGP